MQESRQLILLPAGSRPFETGLKGIMFYDPDTTNWHCLTFSFTLELPSFPCVDLWSPHQGEKAYSSRKSSAIQVSLSCSFGQCSLWATGDQTGAALASSATDCEVLMLGFRRTKRPQLTAPVPRMLLLFFVLFFTEIKRSKCINGWKEHLFSGNITCANGSDAKINACIFGRNSRANLHNSIHHLKIEIKIFEDGVWLPVWRGNKKVQKMRHT